MSIPEKYHKYQLTFPFEGSKIYKSRSINYAVKKCYEEYIKSEYYNRNNVFHVTDIDSKIEYKFHIK